MLDKFKNSFKEEAEELLGQLENILLELEDSPDNPEFLNAAFRAIHTIKGSAGMFGFEEIAKFTHDLENVMDQARSGKLPISKQFIDLALRGRDHIRALLGADEAVPQELISVSESLAAECRDFVVLPEGGPAPSESGGKESSSAERAEDKAAGGGKKTYYIRFQPGAKFLRTERGFCP
jgi:two-component system chemotaxis sensor kinase CheA